MSRLVVWLSKVFRTDVDYIIRGGFWLTIAKVLSTGASLISSVAFANLLPEETYGTFRYVLSIASLLAIPTLHGIESAMSRTIARGGQADFNQALFTRLKYGVLGGLASLLLAGYYWYVGNQTLSLSFVIVAIFVPFMDSFHLYTALLTGKKKFMALARDEVLTRMSVAVVLAGIVFFTKNVIIVLATFFFLTTVLRLVFLIHTIRTEESSGHPDASMLGYGKHLTIMGIFSRVATQVDKILVFHFASGAALAAFFLAFMPMKFAQNILNGLTTLAMPKFSNASTETLRATLPHKLIRLYLIIIPMIIGYYFIAPFFFAVLYPLYPESVFMSQIIFVQLIFFPITLVLTAVTAQKKKGQLYINSTIYAVLRITLLLFLVPTYGALGAIAAIMITALISNSLLVYLFFKH